MFNNKSKNPVFVLSPLKTMLNHVVDWISLHQLEYEMERIDLPDINFF